MSFERALHFRTTPFASVVDTLKAVEEENRRDLRYRHLAFAIWTDFHRRHYGTRQVGAHDISFRPTKCWGEKRFTLDWVPVSLKSKSWNWPGRFATAARSQNYCAFYPKESSKNDCPCSGAGWSLSERPRFASTTSRAIRSARPRSASCVRPEGRRGSRNRAWPRAEPALRGFRPMPLSW
jgi:hypothetical protein